MSQVSSRSPLPSALLALGLALPACSLYGTEPPPPRTGGEVEQVVLKISEVPSDVRCVRITAACTAVTKSTVAPWASAPVEASIVVGRLSTVELTMVRNGRAKVEVTFTDEAACTATGAECRINSECCSRKCGAGSCVATDAGSKD